MLPAAQSQLTGESEPEALSETPPEVIGKRRSSRACDHCRKTKNKCERLEGGAACKSCAAVGIACTFLGPTHKRGPPKGYIRALEQRWYLAESILGAILASSDPRAQAIVSTLRQDELAHEVLSKVDIGPFGSTGRAMKSSFPTMEDLFYGEQAVPQPHGPARANRESRVSREFVSFVQDSTMTPDEVSQWRDRLADLLAPPNKPSYPVSEPITSTSPFPQYQNPQTRDVSGGPPTQKRRIHDILYESEDRLDFSRMYKMEPTAGANEVPHTSDDSDEDMEAFGQLSLDDEQKTLIDAYHDRSGTMARPVDYIYSEGMNERMTVARVNRNFPLSRELLAAFSVREDESDVDLPDRETQQYLLDMYFVHIHPTFPVIHKRGFLSDFQASETLPEGQNQISKLLLLVIFSISERIQTVGGQSEHACDCAAEALKVLRRNVEYSRPVTCQALLLLGMREIAIGSAEHAWLYIGMAIRMAEDLGLNRSGHNWRVKGSQLFSPLENQIRKRIWWACYIAEAHICSFMGRSMSIGRNDYNIDLPEINKDEDDELWQVTGSHGAGNEPIASNTSSCFYYSASLSIIVSDIIRRIYPVRQSRNTSRRSNLTQLQSNLDQWYINLPDRLRYNRTAIVPPYLLVLHMQYWSAVLLLNRAFLPSKVDRFFASDYPRRSSLSLQYLDTCQTAAIHISTIANEYRDKYGLKFTSPILIPYIQSAGIMHAVTLMLRKSNSQAYLGWSQCLAALEDMKSVWPSAQNAWQLLNGVKLGMDVSGRPLISLTDPQTRETQHYHIKQGATDPVPTETTYDTCDPSHGADDVPKVGDALEVNVAQAFSSMGALGQYYPGHAPLPSASLWASWPSPSFSVMTAHVPTSHGYQAPDPSLVPSYLDHDGNMYIDPNLHSSRSSESQ